MQLRRRAGRPQPPSLPSLPADALAAIAQHLPTWEDRTNLSLVCKSAHDAAMAHPGLWWGLRKLKLVVQTPAEARAPLSFLHRVSSKLVHARDVCLVVVDDNREHPELAGLDTELVLALAGACPNITQLDLHVPRWTSADAALQPLQTLRQLDSLQLVLHLDNDLCTLSSLAALTGLTSLWLNPFDPYQAQPGGLCIPNLSSLPLVRLRLCSVDQLDGGLPDTLELLMFDACYTLTVDLSGLTQLECLVSHDSRTSTGRMPGSARTVILSFEPLDFDQGVLSLYHPTLNPCRPISTSHLDLHSLKHVEHLCLCGFAFHDEPAALQDAVAALTTLTRLDLAGVHVPSPLDISMLAQLLVLACSDCDSELGILPTNVRLTHLPDSITELHMRFDDSSSTLTSHIFDVSNLHSLADISILGCPSIDTPVLKQLAGKASLRHAIISSRCHPTDPSGAPLLDKLQRLPDCQCRSHISTHEFARAALGLW